MEANMLGLTKTCFIAEHQSLDEGPMSFQADSLEVDYELE